MDSPRDLSVDFVDLTVEENDVMDDTIGRLWRERFICIRAFYANMGLYLLRSFSWDDLENVLLNDAELDIGVDAASVMVSGYMVSMVKEARNKLPSGKRKSVEEIQTKLESIFNKDLDEAGDYEKYFAFVDYLLRRRGEPDLEWKDYRSSVYVSDVVGNMVGRIVASGRPVEEDDDEQKKSGTSSESQI